MFHSGVSYLDEWRKLNLIPQSSERFTGYLVDWDEPTNIWTIKLSTQQFAKYLESVGNSVNVHVIYFKSNSCILWKEQMSPFYVNYSCLKNSLLPICTLLWSIGPAGGNVEKRRVDVQAKAET